MITWHRITGFDWDAGNERKNAERHQVNQAEAEQVFFNQPLLILQDRKHSQQEARYHALGQSDAARLLHITFTLRSDDTLVRIISVRDMHRKERVFYDRQSKKNTLI